MDLVTGSRLSALRHVPGGSHRAALCPEAKLGMHAPRTPFAFHRQALVPNRQAMGNVLQLLGKTRIPVTTVTAGGRINRVRLEHVWVEAPVDFGPSGGAWNRVADARVPLDASFKQYEYLQGLDVVAIAGIDPQQLADDFVAGGEVDEAEGWVAGLNAGPLEDAQSLAQERFAGSAAQISRKKATAAAATRLTAVAGVTSMAPAPSIR
jgi:hypothetical protein